MRMIRFYSGVFTYVPPSGGSLEIGNKSIRMSVAEALGLVPPSGGSLEIGNPLEHGRWQAAGGQ